MHKSTHVPRLVSRILVCIHVCILTQIHSSAGLACMDPWFRNSLSCHYNYLPRVQVLAGARVLGGPHCEQGRARTVIPTPTVAPVESIIDQRRGRPCRCGLGLAQKGIRLGAQPGHQHGGNQHLHRVVRHYGQRECADIGTVPKQCRENRNRHSLRLLRRHKHERDAPLDECLL